MASAANVPAGTTLTVRLTDAISSVSAKAKQPVNTVLIEPILLNGEIAIPAGAKVTGSITSAESATSDRNAAIGIKFTELESGSTRVRIEAVVSQVDNARETVDATGRIVGIAASETLSAQANRGIEKLAEKWGGLAGILRTAKESLVQDADPQIVYAPGVEMTISLSRAVDVPRLENTIPELVPIANEASLIELAARQPLRAFSAKPVRPSDITNLMIIGSAEQVSKAFEDAGWSTAQALDARSKFETVRAIMESRGYKEGPVSLLTLDGQAPDMVYQKTNNTFAARHHIRIWRRPGNFSGEPIWVCTATHDTGIDFSEEDHTFIHKIDPQIDRERAKVVSDLMFAGAVRSLALVDRPDVPKDATNATGDDLITDGRMAVVVFGGANRTSAR